MSPMRFTVEQRIGGEWRMVAHAMEARSAERAAAHGGGDGHYRVRPLQPLDAPYEYFLLPPWGLPRRIAQ